MKTIKTNTGKDAKIKKKSVRRKFRSRLNHEFFYENFMYDPLKVLSNSMRLSVLG